MKHNCKTQKIFVDTLQSFRADLQVNGGLRIRVGVKASERGKRSNVKETEWEESMVCWKVISPGRISNSFLLVTPLHLAVFYLKDLS